MPSASAKLEKQMSTEAYDPMKQIVTIVEKKVRNLEKRKGKLDSYRLDSQNGKELNEDQKKAVEKYNQVVELLDFAKDLQKQFQGVVQETSKAQKKAAKRDQLERQQQELQRIKEIMVYQDLLNSMGGEDVRQDFLDGNKGAVKLSEAELNSLDELYKAICPERDVEAENVDFDNVLSTASEHIQALLDAKNKEAFGTTYKALRETLQKIHSCSYFQKCDESPQSEADSNASEEKDQEQQSEPNASSEVEEYAMVQNSEEYSPVPQAEQQYYQMESSTVYAAEQPPQPIQEVLSGTNLNFLQESQIEVGAPQHEPQQPAALTGVNCVSAPYPPPTQHITRRPSEEAMSNTPASLLANQGSIQQVVPSHQPGQAIPTQPADFRPIPTQTYTNASFHPMMAPPPQSYGPAPQLMTPPHVLPVNMVQPIPQRSAVTSSVPLSVAPVSGLSTASQLSQQANIYSLCLKMNQLNTESSQPAHVQSLQYDSSEIQENNVTKHSGTYGNGGHAPVPENRTRTGNNAYSRCTAQVEFVNERAPYQSSNNNQAYMTRDNFGDNSSYSSNLKRGLTSRGGARGAGAPRGGNTIARGNRVGHRY